MPDIPYFHSEALRQRFERNLQEAHARTWISIDELQDLQRLCDPEPSPSSPFRLYRVLLEDGSPEPLEVASSLMIQRGYGDSEILYLDTLGLGFRRFNDRQQLERYLQASFAASADLMPSFEYQSLDGPLFQQRMWQVVAHQARSLGRLAEGLQELPSLHQALQQALEPRFRDIWPDALPDLDAPLVQVMEAATGGLDNSSERVLQACTLEQAAVDTLTGQTLPEGQWRRLLNLDGQAVRTLDMADLCVSADELSIHFEKLLHRYWHAPDPHGLSRSQRAAQVLADSFRHQVWTLEQSEPVLASRLSRLTSSALYVLSPMPASRLAVLVDDQGPYKLVGLYLIHLQQGAGILYSPLKGLRYLSDRQALLDLIDSPAGREELLACVSLNDLTGLTAESRLQLYDYPLAKPLFLDCLDAIIALQMRNIAQAVQARSHDRGQWLARLDDALDVRMLLDGRLPYLGAPGRWLAQPEHFRETWSGSPTAGAREAMDTGWLEQVALCNKRLAELHARRPDLQALTRQLLSPWLAVLGFSRPDEEQQVVPVAHGSAAPLLPDGQTLTDLVLEHYSGKSVVPLPADGRLLRLRGVSGTSHVPASLIPPLLERVAGDLENACVASVEAFHDRPAREAKAQSVAGQLLCASREQLLRMELIVARRRKVIAAPLLEVLQDVLDRPESRMRRDRAQVCTASLMLGGRTLTLGLNIFWIVRDPRQPEHGLLFWSARSGLQSMRSTLHLQDWLGSCLQRPDDRALWLNLLASDDRQWVDRVLAANFTLTLTLTAVEGHFIRHIQQDEQLRQKQEIVSALHQARHSRLSALPAGRYVRLVQSDDRLLAWLDALAIRVQNQLFSSLLPEWLNQASLADLDRYTHLLLELFRNSDPAEDFLADIPRMREFSRQRLLAALRRDFPGLDLEPRDIILTLTRYIPTPVPPGSIPSSLPAATLADSENLVDFALSHFSSIQSGSLRVNLSDDTPVPAGMTAAYLSALVRELDVGLQYQTLLAERFDPARPEYAVRRERFIRQVPVRLRLSLIELKMQKLLSPLACDFVESVVVMPDGKARQPVHGQDIVWRPLTLLPRPEMEGDKVQGFFVIGPRDPNQGPVVLHTLADEWSNFMEFTDQQHLLAELRREGPLQNLLLDRVDPSVRRRYANGGLVEAHIPWHAGGGIGEIPPLNPGEVHLGNLIVEGNALSQLFEDTVQLMRSLSRKQSVTNAQADWTSFVQLMKLGVEQVLMFVPGRLGLLVALWQGQSLLRESASALSDQKWGQALGQFASALAMLVSTRQAEQESSGKSRARTLEFSWHMTELTPDLKVRLSQFEVRDVELSSLRHDALRNLYLNPQTRLHYAAVEGKVYQVHLREGVWRIHGKAGEGPKLKQRSDQQWQLDLEPGLRGGGLPTLSGEQNLRLQQSIDRYIVPLAEGIEAIRAYSREDAHKIVMARFQAINYLQTAMLNLNAPFAAGLAEPVQSILSGFFGVPGATPDLINDLKWSFAEVFGALSEPSFSPLDSPRYVLGSFKPGYERLNAFVISGDPRRRLFLGDEFFVPPQYSVMEAVPGIRAFRSDDHFRALILIHELSHQASHTEDIAYLDSNAPPLDMLKDHEPHDLAYKQQLQRLRSQALSISTPENQLFSRRDLLTGDLRDLQPSDGQVFQAILAVTEQPDLPAARRAFLSDPEVRIRVILTNADSVALLAAMLGRERFQ